MENMPKMHTNVLLKSGVPGVIRGFYQDNKDSQVNVLIEDWSKGTKSTAWYISEDFKVVE